MDLKDLSTPPVLYHYTSWDTFEKIVKIIHGDFQALMELMIFQKI